jgi:hypothetical protein
MWKLIGKDVLHAMFLFQLFVAQLLDNLLFSFGDNLTFGAAERMELV